ncbi:MAG TPA: hypothetical protein VGO93_30225 [Candidatus Xenobia bacterium]
MHKTVLFVKANDEVADHLQKAVAAHASTLAQAHGLPSIFVVLRRFQSTSRPQEVASQALMSIDPLYVRHLNPAAFKAPYEAIGLEESKAQALLWMVQGVASESPGFSDGEAARIVLDEFYSWVGTSVSSFVNQLPLFKIAGIKDRGLALVGSNRIAMLWFLGAE